MPYLDSDAETSFPVYKVHEHNGLYQKLPLVYLFLSPVLLQRLGLKATRKLLHAAQGWPPDT